MKKILIIEILVATLSSFLLIGCSSSFKASYDPFANINVELSGSEGKAVISLDTSEILNSNISLINESKLTSDNKNDAIVLFKEISEQIDYKISKDSQLSNGDDVYISFADIGEGSQELQESLHKNIIFTSSTMTYKVENLEKLFTTKKDLSDDDYQKIKSKSESLIKSHLSKLSSENKKFSNIVYIGQFIIDRGNTDGSKSVLTLFTGVANSKMIDTNVLNEYVYPYVITDINYDSKDKAILNYDADINYISRYYQTDDFNELLKDKFTSIENIELIINKNFKNINDLPSDYFSMFDVSINKELSNITKEKLKKDIVMGDVSFYKCYLLADNYKDSNNKSISRNSIVLVYTYTSKLDNNTTYGYSFNIFNYFLYNNDNVMIDYKTSFKQHEQDVELTETEIIGMIKSDKSNVEEIPF